MAFHVYDQTKILKHMGLGQRFNARRTDDDIAGYGFPGEREQTEAIGIYGDRAIGQFQRNAACRSYGQTIGNILWKPRPGGPGIHQKAISCWRAGSLMLAMISSKYMSLLQNSLLACGRLANYLYLLF
jgi:hypothetical protein